MPKKKITIEQLSQKLSDDVKKLNPHLDTIQKSKSKRHPRRTIAQTLTDEAAGKTSMGNRHPIVSITSYRKRILDDDNLRGGLKTLRDEIARYIGMDDAERFVQWRYHQVKVSNQEEQGVFVKITK